MAHFFGYAKDPNGNENPLGFFDYSDEGPGEYENTFLGYKEHNKRFLENISKQEKKSLELNTKGTLL